MHADKRRWNICFCSGLILDSGSGWRHGNRMNKKPLKSHKANSLGSASLSYSRQSLGASLKRRQEVEILDCPETVNGDPVLPRFVLQMAKIW
jgi:hypothetical protein